MPSPPIEYRWRYYSRQAWGKPASTWTAYVDAVNGHVLAWNAAKPDASVAMWSYNPELATWVWERSYTAADPAPFPELAQQSASGEMPAPPSGLVPGAMPRFQNYDLLDVQAAANRSVIMLTAAFVIGAAAIGVAIKLQHRARRR